LFFLRRGTSKRTCSLKIDGGVVRSRQAYKSHPCKSNELCLRIRQLWVHFRMTYRGNEFGYALLLAKHTGSRIGAKLSPAVGVPLASTAETESSVYLVT
jgi:hypothetical protein